MINQGLNITEESQDKQPKNRGIGVLPTCVVCSEQKDEPMISFQIAKLGYCLKCLEKMKVGKIDKK